MPKKVKVPIIGEIESQTGKVRYYQQEIVLELTGNILGKKNYYRRGRGSSFYKPDKIRVFEEDILWQIKGQLANYKKIELPFKSSVEVSMHFIVKNKRADLDNKFTALLDLLKTAGIIKDDSLKYVVSGHFEGRRGKLEQTQIIVREINLKNNLIC